MKVGSRPSRLISEPKDKPLVLGDQSKDRDS